MLAVAGHQVGDVVADHPAEPAALLAGVREVVASTYAGAATQMVTRVRVAAGVGGGGRAPP